MASIISGVRITPPPGLTPGGKLHQFQGRTIQNIEESVRPVVQSAQTRLQQRLRSRFNSPDATGETAKSVDFQVQRSGSGIGAVLTIGNFRQVQYMTSLNGGDFHAVDYPIVVKNAKNLRFFWKRRNVLFRGPVVNHPGFGPEDIPLEEAQRLADELRSAAVNAVSHGLMELTTGEGTSTTRHIRRR